MNDVMFQLRKKTLYNCLNLQFTQKESHPRVTRLRANNSRYFSPIVNAAACHLLTFKEKSFSFKDPYFCLPSWGRLRWREAAPFLPSKMPFRRRWREAGIPSVRKPLETRLCPLASLRAAAAADADVFGEFLPRLVRLQRKSIVTKWNCRWVFRWINLFMTWWPSPLVKMLSDDNHSVSVFHFLFLPDRPANWSTQKLARCN